MRQITIMLIILLLAACNEEVVTYDFDLQGHRGARGLLPENTIPGFLLAVDHGVDTIEFDVVVTRDRKILISHEPWFHHHISTKPDGTPVREDEEQEFNIFEMTYEETRQFDTGIRGHVHFPEQEPMEVSKPLMRDAIIAVEEYVEEWELDPIRYNIETKSRPEWYNSMVPPPGEFARILYNELVELDILDRVIIQSFDPATLIEMRRIDPDIDQAMLISSDERPMQAYIDTLGYTPEIWSPHFELLSPEIIEDAREHGMYVIPWTINDPQEMKRQLEMGVDGIITDYPDRANRFRQ